MAQPEIDGCGAHSPAAHMTAFAIARMDLSGPLTWPLTFYVRTVSAGQCWRVTKGPTRSRPLRHLPPISIKERCRSRLVHRSASSRSRGRRSTSGSSCRPREDTLWRQQQAEAPRLARRARRQPAAAQQPHAAAAFAAGRSRARAALEGAAAGAKPCAADYHPALTGSALLSGLMCELSRLGRPRASHVRTRALRTLTPRGPPARGVAVCASCAPCTHLNEL